MIKIWGKVIKRERIVKSKTIEIDPSTMSFFDMLKTISIELNIPTPVLLDKHVYDFNVFHFSTFKTDDFIESVEFDSFVVQLLRD